MSHIASSAASAGCLVCLMTASVDPPQLAETFSPAVHCGSGAARHLPAVLFAEPDRKTGPQAAVTQAAYRPLLRPWYHSSVKSGSWLTTPSVSTPPSFGGKLVRNTFGSAACSLRAAAANSSHVVGTAMLCCLRMSSR